MERSESSRVFLDLTVEELELITNALVYVQDNAPYDVYDSGEVYDLISRFCYLLDKEVDDEI